MCFGSLPLSLKIMLTNYCMIPFLASTSTIQGQKGDKGAPGENRIGETGQKGDRGFHGHPWGSGGKQIIPIFPTISKTFNHEFYFYCVKFLMRLQPVMTLKYFRKFCCEVLIFTLVPLFF